MARCQRNSAVDPKTMSNVRVTILVAMTFTVPLEHLTISEDQDIVGTAELPTTTCSLKSTAK